MNNTALKILIVDDEEDILEFVSYNLKNEGYQVFTSDNGAKAIHIAEKEIPHLIILDIMMPEKDGVETCKDLRKISKLKNTIITFFTARSEDYSQIAGFEAGADDYITKPIKPKVLLSKVAALLRRHHDIANASLSYTIGNLAIDKEKYKVFYEGKEIVLPKKEFELLFLLASKPNKVFTRDEIYSKVWDDDVLVGERTIDVHIRKIREKLGGDNIKTIKGVGYKYEQ